METTELTIKDIVCLHQSGRMTTEALVREYLERIDSFDKRGPCINAIISINPHVYDEARILDDYLQMHGLIGPLHGVPVILKDNFEAAGTVTTAGSLAFKTFGPNHDGFAVKRLREAGAIILGKANLHEFALGGTTGSSLGGQTLNPYDLARTPGGSSGGTGAAVAANFCAVGMGSDTVNSIRSPASAMNVVGLRPTWGLVSRSGVFPVSPTQDAIGPIARCVEDAARILDVIAGYDVDDGATAWSVGQPLGQYRKGISSDGSLDGIRIGLCNDLFGASTEHKEVNHVILSAVKHLEGIGAKLVSIDNTGIDIEFLNDNVDLQKFEYKRAINSYLSHNASTSPFSTLYQLKKSECIHNRDLQRFFYAADSVDPCAGTGISECNRRLVAAFRLRQQLARLMAKYNVDVLAYPLQRRLVVPIGEQKQADRNGILAALTGFPAIDVPAGFSSATETAPIGVPVGLDFLGRPWSESLLLRVAHSFEKFTAYRQQPQSTATV